MTEVKKRTRMKAFDYINYILLALFAICAVYPLLYTLAGSLNDGYDYDAGGVWIFPRMFTLANYHVVLSDSRLWRAFLITVIKTVSGTALALLVTSCVSYAMANPKLKFKSFFQWFNLFTMFFSGGLIPYFLVINVIGLYDTFWVYIIPTAYSVYNMIIIQNFFKSISYELKEAAIIDGAGEFKIWLSIYMPLSGAVLATVGLWCIVGHWNNYMSTMLYTQNQNLITLQYYLIKIIKEANVDFSDIGSDISMQVTTKTVTYAAIIVATLPILLVYPFLLKFFAGSVMIGSLKG